MSTRTVVILALAAFAVLAAICLPITIPRIERDLQMRALDALATAGISVEEVSCRGRHLTLAGPIASADLAERAAQIAGGVPGVRRVTTRLTIGPENAGPG